MNRGKQLSFATLFDDVDAIEIPIIQRDYAQGRPQAVDVRASFLETLKEALTAENLAISLDLDFVYGSVEYDSSKVLSVLDGQQRLTTLFLLHWYLAMHDGQLDSFQARWKNNGRSRFTYATRPSSAEFFNSLVNAAFSLSDSQKDCISLSTALVDCNWFFLAWRNDPTVQSCLTMLDTIDEKFRDNHGLYQKLIDPERPRITFHYLELRDFGLSDDLYIKMNARGKPLTPFENFKAWMVGRVAQVSWSAEFDENMDQKWIDFFWRLSKEKKSSDDGSGFDDLFLRFLYLVAFFESCRRLDRGYWSAGESVRSWIARLRDARGYVSLRDFEEQRAFDEDTLKLIRDVLDYFSGTATHEDIKTLERALSKQQDYVDLMKLYSVISFVEASGDLDAQDLATTKAQWSRVTANLINNTRIDDLGITASVIRGMKSLSCHATCLYPMLAETPPKNIGFSPSQILEESKKAALIIEDASWEPLFIKAEIHPYLQGQIGFLLNFSRSDDGRIDQAAFRQYTIKVSGVLSSDILHSKDFLLQRALLSLKDYLVFRGAGKYSFCEPNATAFRYRSENWLRVVVNPEFKQLLDLIGDDVQESLKDVIKMASCEDWRKHIVADPKLISYCQDRLIHREALSTIYLLSKTRLSGYFVELQSYALYLEMNRQHRAGKLPYIKSLNYDAVYGDAVPTLSITMDNVVKIRYENPCWQCYANGVTIDMPAKIEAFIQDNGWQT
jgi:hypothetical protein